MNYNEILNDAKFVSKSHDISLADAIIVVTESCKIEQLKEINDSIKLIADNIDEDSYIFQALDNISDAIVNK